MKETKMTKKQRNAEAIKIIKALKVMKNSFFEPGDSQTIKINKEKIRNHFRLNHIIQLLSAILTTTYVFLVLSAYEEINMPQKYAVTIIGVSLFVFLVILYLTIVNIHYEEGILEEEIK